MNFLFASAPHDSHGGYAGSLNGCLPKQWVALQKGNTGFRDSLFFIVRDQQACSLAEADGILSHRMLATNTAMKSGSSKEWSGPCILEHTGTL
jgi:hypothetical protein